MCSLAAGSFCAILQECEIVHERFGCGYGDDVMTAYVSIPFFGEASRSVAPEQRVKVVVNVNADVLDAEIARRKANVWLLDHVGNLLGASTPELVIGERLMWRYDVILGIPNLEQPGSGAMYKVGQIMLDAETGEIENASEVAQELQQNAAALGC